MLHRKKMCRNICIYFIFTLIALASICLLLISKEGTLATTNTVYGTVRLPLKDSLDRKNLGEKLTHKKVVFKQNSSVVASGSKGEKHKAVVQIDKLILSLIEQIEKSDNSIKGKIKQPGKANFTCPQRPRIVKEVEDLLCMVCAFVLNAKLSHVRAVILIIIMTVFTVCFYIVPRIFLHRTAHISACIVLHAVNSLPFTTDRYHALIIKNDNAMYCLCWRHFKCHAIYQNIFIII